MDECTYIIQHSETISKTHFNETLMFHTVKGIWFQSAVYHNFPSITLFCVFSCTLLLEHNIMLFYPLWHTGTECKMNALGNFLTGFITMGAAAFLLLHTIVSCMFFMLCSVSVCF